MSAEDDLSDDSRLRLDWWVFGATGVAAFLVLVIGLGWNHSLADLLIDGAADRDELDARSTVIDTTVRVALAVVATTIGWFTLRRVRAIERQAVAASEQLVVARQQFAIAESGHQTDRYSKAIEQLGSAQVNVRIGGLYALASIAQDAPERFAGTAYDVLVAFVREQTRPEPELAARRREALALRDRTIAEGNLLGAEEFEVPMIPPVGTDVETAVRVLGDEAALFATWRPFSQVSSLAKGANLSGVNLSGRWLEGLEAPRAVLVGADLDGAELRLARLSGVDFTDASLVGSRIRSADLSEVIFVGTDLSGAQLEGSMLGDADLTLADLESAFLLGANFFNARLVQARLSGATLVGANFTGAWMHGSFLMGADLTGADLTGADLTGADLTGADLQDVVRPEGFGSDASP